MYCHFLCILLKAMEVSMVSVDEGCFPQQGQPGSAERRWVTDSEYKDRPGMFM